MARKTRTERVRLYRSRAYKVVQQDLARSVRRLRGKRHWTQEESAHRCGMATRLFQRVEAAAANVTLTTIARLCEGFGVTAEELFRNRPR